MELSKAHSKSTLVVEIKIPFKFWQFAYTFNMMAQKKTSVRSHTQNNISKQRQNCFFVCMCGKQTTATKISTKSQSGNKYVTRKLTVQTVPKFQKQLGPIR